MSIKSYNAGKMEPVFSSGRKTPLSPEATSMNIQKSIIANLNKMNYDPKDVFSEFSIGNIVVIAEGPRRESSVFDLATARVHRNPPVKSKAA